MPTRIEPLPPPLPPVLTGHVSSLPPYGSGLWPGPRRGGRGRGPRQVRARACSRACVRACRSPPPPLPTVPPTASPTVPLVLDSSARCSEAAGVPSKQPLWSRAAKNGRRGRGYSRGHGRENSRGGGEARRGAAGCGAASAPDSRAERARQPEQGDRRAEHGAQCGHVLQLLLRRVRLVRGEGRDVSA